MSTQTSNVDNAEIAKFDALASRWWDPAGEFRPLHEINPLRLDYIRQRVGLGGTAVVDIGCGGGILAESMAAAGARVEYVERRQIAAVRNDGARVATGDRFVFVDADTVVPPETLADAWRALDDGAVGGGAHIRMDGDVPRLAGTIVTVAARLFVWAGLTGGAFIFANRTDFEAVGGFDEALFASEEIALTKALKARGRFVVVRSSVVTSGRKLRQYSLPQILGLVARQAVKGPRGAWRSREGLEVWYGPRLGDPDGR